MSKSRFITLGGLERFFQQIASMFAYKHDVESKVDKVNGKELSSNDFTDDYKTVCDYILPLKDEGVLSLALRGPDGKIYRLALNDEMRLVLEEFNTPRQVRYLISNGNYYYLEEDGEGLLYITRYDGIPPEEECGYVRAVSSDTGMKFTINVLNDDITFDLYEGTGLDEREAKYMVYGNKICYFRIEDEQVQIYYESTTVRTNKLYNK